MGTPNIRATRHPHPHHIHIGPVEVLLSLAKTFSSLLWLGFSVTLLFFLYNSLYGRPDATSSKKPGSGSSAGGGLGPFSILHSPGNYTEISPENVNVKFDDVRGTDESKKELQVFPFLFSLFISHGSLRFRVSVKEVSEFAPENNYFTFTKPYCHKFSGGSGIPNPLYSSTN